jgi:transcriptional regulator with PAS, ATPase and Fis domain
MKQHDWIKEFPGAITVCDADGTITAMNDKSVESFASDGGSRLIGKNVLDCHPEPARSKLKGMLASGQANVYTIKKNGKKKLIFQAPWRRDGEYAGFVELSLEIPWTMPHFDRDKS